MLGRDESDTRVATPDIGGGFDRSSSSIRGRDPLHSGDVPRRPVKWIEDRREHFVATTQERDQYWEIEVARDEDGKLLGIRGEIVHDHGAYTGRGTTFAANSAETLTMGYVVPTCRMNVKVAPTNKIPTTPSGAPDIPRPPSRWNAFWIGLRRNCPSTGPKAPPELHPARRNAV